LVSIAALLAGGAALYADRAAALADAPLRERLASLEATSAAMSKQLERIERKLDDALGLARSP
jgi:hypothetical protein